MTVNQLMVKLRREQSEGNGKLKVHFLAHDNSLGETQGEINSVFHYEKQDDFIGDESLYESLPSEIVYLGV